MVSRIWRSGISMISVASAAAICIASAAIVDPDGVGPDVRFLKGVERMLDRAGIDVVLGVASALPPPQRPRLGSLKGFTPARNDWGDFEKAGWSLAFENGVAGVIFAYRPRSEPTALGRKREACDAGTEEKEGCDFVYGWLNADPEDRVFIAFTKDDFESASAVRSSLQQAGFVVFMFLKGKEEKPWADPSMVGEVFAQANHRLVVDSRSARGSVGLQFESLCCEPKLLPPYPLSKLAERLTTGR